ncbi:Retrovirus-related Pol polyprotein from transposon TNT 1-94 [Trichinella zimbabwensis]|uniref:Retrovirus-related Pol polyprotein from transposon TNT 1-94 n=1 Tax=Trichinella zimbabwensis TaxID=268475 RepID=A0A0V1HVQ1_9BILA|nr:Retrovirus-related Pol polyprotein from transposon TNT 1-94 [Trichinella zimbabwensis]
MKLLVGKFSTERNMQSVSRLPVGEAVGCRCEDMKALPVALITVASIGIVSLIGIGLFFALLPTKTKISPQAATFETTIMPITSTTFSTRTTTSRQLEHQPSLPTTEPENSSSRTLNPTVIWSEPPPSIQESTVGEPPESDSAEDVLITPRTFNFESWTEQSPWTENVQSKAIGFITSGRSGAVAVDPGKSRFTLHVKPTIVIEDQESVQLVMVNELELDHFGKASGMTLRNHILAVCSYTFGQIVLFEPETLKKLTELNCDGCTLFDLDIMSNGDLVSVDAKHEKVIKMRSTGERLAERHVHGATRGVSVCMDDRIYVLVEGGPYIHLLDSFLNNLGTITFYKNQSSKLDCRYLLCIENLLHISCDDAVYLLDVQNGNVTSIQPTENSVYGLGIGVDSSDNVFVAKRGSSSVDVFKKDGQFLKTLNADRQFLCLGDAVAHGYKIMMDNFNIRLMMNNRTKLVGYKDEDVYTLLIRRSSDNTSMSAMPTEGETHSFELWYQRLGHIGVEKLKIMMQKNLVEGLRATAKGKFFCEGCVFDSMTQKPHKEIIERRQSVPGEILHANVCGPFIHPSVGGGRYFICFKDESSGYRMKGKGEILRYLKIAMAEIKQGIGCDVQRIRTYGGTEFVNKEFDKFLIERGIVHEESSPYTPQCNEWLKERTEHSLKRQGQ